MPDGVVISGIAGDVSTAVIYHGMHGDAVYFKNGISLEGVVAPVVVDAGGNIGLFSRYIALKFPNAHVYGAEPIDVLAKTRAREQQAIC
jgi:hypothetical protein